MKGVVFTEFIEMLEKQFGFELADSVIHESHPASGGVYTAVGLYDDSEMYAMVAVLSKKIDVPEPELLMAFGNHLFGRFEEMFPHFVNPATDAFDLLSSVDDFIHVEVHKLYPDAQLPKISCEPINDRTLIVHYKSHRPMGDLAEGLIRGAIAHFDDEITISRIDTDPQKRQVEFTLTHAL